MSGSAVGFAAIPWYRRIQVQVALGVGLLAGCTLAVILMGASLLVANQSMDLAKKRLETAHVAFNRLVENRREFAAARLRLVTQLPVFRAHISDPRLSGDSPTMEAMTEDYRDQLGGQFLILAKPEGRWLVAPGWSGTEAQREVLTPLIQNAASAEGDGRIVSIGGTLFLVVSEPVRFAEELLGTLTVGYRLDDTFAKGLADVTDSQVVLMARGRVTAGSLPEGEVERLGSQLASLSATTVGATLSISEHGQINYVAGRYPLTDGNQLVLLQSWAPTQLFLDRIRQGLFAVGAVVLAAGLAFAVIFAMRVTKPLRQVAEAANEIARGNWNGEVPADGGEEAAVMASAFNAMTQRLRESHDHLRQRTVVLEEEVLKRKRVEEELRISTAVAARANIAKSAFLANMSHELRNPLHTILGYTEMLTEEAAQEGRTSHVEDLGRIHGSSKHLLHLIDGILDISRVDSGHIELLPGEVSVPALVRDVVSAIEPEMRLRGNQLTVNTGADCHELWADGTRAREILLRLLDNAAKFTLQGSVQLDVNLAHGGARMEFSIRDTGIGIATEHLPELFVSFRQLDPSAGRKYGGAGLGLALSRTLARAMGGDVWVESEFGVGSTFTLSLPASVPARGPVANEGPKLAQVA